MKKLVLLLIIVCTHHSMKAQQAVFNGSEDTGQYTSKEIGPQYDTQLKAEEDKKNFKKLREFLRERNDLLTALNEVKSSFRDYTEEIKFLNKKKLKFESLIKDAKATDVIEMERDVWFGFYYNEDYVGSDSTAYYYGNGKLKKTVSQIRDAIDNLEERAKRLQLLSAQYAMLERNISAIKQDIYKCTSQIDSTLAPEYQEQSFRIWISVCFTVLIAVLLITFFYIVYKKSDNTLSKDLLSGNGLQFITLFVLIIAIILFGILNILQGTELATILSGISGYILGKGVNVLADKPLTIKKKTT